MSKQNKGKAYIMLVTAMLIMGTVGGFRKYISLSSGLLAQSRGVLGALFLIIFIFVKKRNLRFHVSKKQVWLLIITGGCLGINWMLLFEAFNYTSVATATLCYYMQPTIVLVLAAVFLKEKITLKRAGCAVVSLIGMVFVSGVFDAGGMSGINSKGIVLALCAAFFYSLIIIMNKKIGEADVYEKTLIQLVSAAVVMIPYILITEKNIEFPTDGNTIILVIIVGILHTGIAYALYYGAMQPLSAQSISALSYIDPVVALLVSALYLKENVGFGCIPGALLILGAAFIGEINVKNKITKEAGDENDE